MSRFRPLLLHFLVLAYVFWTAETWHVYLPSNIKALEGSCVHIPCSFDYYSDPPQRPNRVVWYKWVNRGYPLVYDNWYKSDVMDEYSRRTAVYTGNRRCSLYINPVTWFDHRQKLYPWVDPENVGKSTYRFFDATVTIEVVGSPKVPEITITGKREIGKMVTVQCSADHTCSINSPNLSLNIPFQKYQQSQTDLGGGKYRVTLTTTLTITKQYQTIECTVRHYGGKTANVSTTLNAQCSILPLSISPSSTEFLEGIATKVTCTALYTCRQHRPTFTWNFAGMPASTNTAEVSGQALWKTVSTLTFTSAANDHGKQLTCNAQFPEGPIKTSIPLHVRKSMLSLDWSFTTPGSLQGLKGSCIIIPCKFSYSKTKPGGLQVIWYLYQSKGYQSVYNQNDGNTISKFAGLTSLIGSVSDGNCSLIIDKLEMSHNKDRLYPWIDKNSIASYHSQSYSFLDKSTQLEVSESAEEPQMSIIGIPVVGEDSKVSCTVRHACIIAPPVLTLSGIPGTDQVTDSQVSDGVWERTVERTWTVDEQHNRVVCSLKYPSGQTARSELLLNVECPYEKISMINTPGVMIEGMAQSVVCSVAYKCKKNKPSIVWNYPDMESTVKTIEISKNTYKTSSNLTFIGSLNDNGKDLKCTAEFNKGETSDSSVLKIAPYEYKFGEDEPFDTGDVQVLQADVPYTFNALSRSCVVIPCSFQSKEHELMSRGIWYKKSGHGIIFHNGRSYIIDHFKDRTKLIGDIHEGECSLEIDKIKSFDNGPFCFHAQKGDVKYKFTNNCVFLKMKASPDKPVMSTVPAEVNAGSTVSVSCSVSHTCPSHPPEFSWSVPNITNKVSDTLISQGVWQRTSTITFMVPEGDGVKSLTCKAIFWREIQQNNTNTLQVKGTSMYHFQKVAPVAIPVTILLLITAAVLGVFLYRKIKQSNDPLKPPPRPEKRRSLWERFSRRYPQGNRGTPSRPEERRTEEDHVGWNNERRSFWNRFSRRQDNPANRSVGYLRTSDSVDFNTHTSKPRCPSPKNNQRRPAPPTPEDHYLYGNI